VVFLESGLACDLLLEHTINGSYRTLQYYTAQMKDGRTADCRIGTKAETPQNYLAERSI
jgi:hypothetical protein